MKTVLEKMIERAPEDLRDGIAQMHNTILHLQEEVRSLRKALYMKKAETYLAGEYAVPKCCLFNEAEELLLQVSNQDASEDEEDAKSDKPPKPRQRGKRKPFPEHLPREEVVHDVAEEEKICKADGTPLVKIGEEVTEKLDIIPATVKVVRHIYPKYGCPQCHTGVTECPAEPSVLPKATFEPALLAYLTRQKYLMALPLYRLEQDFAQLGIELPRTTMARWMVEAGSFLTPLYDQIRNFILQHSAIHADETRVEVLKGKNKVGPSNAFMWVMATPEDAKPAVYFHFAQSRGGSVATHLLKGFQGYLHADGYQGYNEICKTDGIIRVGCWAHARRKFDEAKVIGAADGRGLCDSFLVDIQRLFLIEREIQEYPPDKKLEARRKNAAPILDEIKTRVETSLCTIPAKSKIGKALAYLHDEWPHLTRFLESGDVALSNNRVENFIRPFALGRKNWLFSNSIDGAEASACLYSIIISAKANGLDVMQYLTALFTELPRKYAQEQSCDLTPYLPWNWKPTTHP